MKLRLLRMALLIVCNSGFPGIEAPASSQGGELWRLERRVPLDAFSVVSNGHDQVQLLRIWIVDYFVELHNVRVIELLHDLYLLVNVVQSRCEILQETPIFASLSSIGATILATCARGTAHKASLLLQVGLDVDLYSKVFRNVAFYIEVPKMSVDYLHGEVDLRLRALAKSLQHLIFVVEN